MMDEDVSGDKKPTILTEKRRGFSVGPSPFNPVKLELGILIVVGLLLVLVVERMSADAFIQLMLLVAYAVAGAGWLAWRVRRVYRARVEYGQE